MNIDLNPVEMETILTSLEYSKERVRNAPDTPYVVRRETLDRLDAVAAKLRETRRAISLESE